MFDAAYIHVTLNHVPAVATLIGFVILVAGLVSRQPAVKATGLFVLVFAGLAVIPTFLTGEPAEDLVKALPDVMEAHIHEHEAAAKFGLISSLLTGALAASALFSSKLNRQVLARRLTLAVLLLSVHSFATLMRVAYLGGHIRHQELRPAMAETETAK